MIWQSRVIPAGRIARRKDRFVDAESGRVIAAMHGLEPLRCRIVHLGGSNAARREPIRRPPCCLGNGPRTNAFGRSQPPPSETQDAAVGLESGYRAICS